jgi:hypothetical protein
MTLSNPKILNSYIKDGDYYIEFEYKNIEFVANTFGFAEEFLPLDSKEIGFTIYDKNNYLGLYGHKMNWNWLYADNAPFVWNPAKIVHVFGKESTQYFSSKLAAYVYKYKIEGRIVNINTDIDDYMQMTSQQRYLRIFRETIHHPTFLKFLDRKIDTYKKNYPKYISQLQKLIKESVKHLNKVSSTINIINCEPKE